MGGEQPPNGAGLTSEEDVMSSGPVVTAVGALVGEKGALAPKVRGAEVAEEFLSSSYHDAVVEDFCIGPRTYSFGDRSPLGRGAPLRILGAQFGRGGGAIWVFFFSKGTCGLLLATDEHESYA